MEPSGRDALEAAEECAHVAVDLVDPAQRRMVLGIGCRAHGNLQLGYDLGIRLVLVGVHDGPLADPAFERFHSDFGAQRSPAADIEEVVARIVERRQHADLLVADTRFGTGTVLPRFSGPVLHSIEAGSLEALTKVDLIDLHPVAGLGLERRQIREYGLHGTEPHEPRRLVADAEPRRDLVACETVDEAGREVHPGAFAQLRVEEDASGLPVASDASAFTAFPSLGSRLRLPVADAFLASAIGADHVGNIDVGSQKLLLKGGLEIGDHLNAGFRILLGQEGRDVLDDRFLGHVRHIRTCACAYKNS